MRIEVWLLKIKNADSIPNHLFLLSASICHARFLSAACVSSCLCIRLHMYECVLLCVRTVMQSPAAQWMCSESQKDIQSSTHQHDQRLSSSSSSSGAPLRLLTRNSPNFNHKYFTSHFWPFLLLSSQCCWEHCTSTVQNRRKTSNIVIWLSTPAFLVWLAVW